VKENLSRILNTNQPLVARFTKESYEQQRRTRTKIAAGAVGVAGTEEAIVVIVVGSVEVIESVGDVTVIGSVIGIVTDVMTDVIVIVGTVGTVKGGSGCDAPDRFKMLRHGNE